MAGLELSGISDGLAGAVESAAAAVVTVDARRRVPASGIVWTPNTVVTCDHVLEREDDISVRLAGGRELPATIAGRDAGSDIAVLRVEGGLAPIERASAVPRVGHLALAVGRPSAGGIEASLGIVSAVGGPWRTFRGTRIEGYFRTDTTFFPGFSGGPLIDVSGHAVGLNSSRLGRGAGLTLPIAVVERIAADLAERGHLRRAYLGVSSQQVSLPEAIAGRLNGQESGLLIVSVEPGSPADAAGMVIGDVLVAIGGAATPGTEALQSVLGTELIGQPTAVRIVRGGEPRELSVTPGER